MLTEKENVLFEALDVADDESELNITYAELVVLADRGYVQMKQLGNRMNEKISSNFLKEVSVKQ